MDRTCQQLPIAACASLSLFDLGIVPPVSQTGGFSPAGSQPGKRVVDMVVSFALLVLSFPVLIACAILIKLDTPGPVLFRQVRLGRSFRPFTMLKLRSMDVAAEGPAFTPDGDPRVTRTGRWLRRFKLDELPQFWNVLCGHMSLVGPRPVHPAIVARFRTQYVRLLAVRPGLTDPATLQFAHEDEILAQANDPQRYFFSVITPAKLRIARDYVDRASPWTDCLVLAATAHTLLRTVLRTSLAIPGFSANCLSNHR